MKKCMIRGRYEQTAKSISISAVNRMHFWDKNAIQWLSERLPTDFITYVTQMFDALYRSKRRACFIDWKNSNGVRLSERYKVYVSGLDFARNKILITFKKRRDEDDESTRSSEYMVKAYPMPSNEDDTVPGLKVRWGDLLRAFAIHAILNLHENDLLQELNKLIRNKETNVILISIETYHDIVVGSDDYYIDLVFDTVDDLYLEFRFEPYPHIQSLAINLDETRMYLATLLKMVGYYSPHKKQGFFYDRQNQALVIGMNGDEEGVWLTWKDAWIDLHRDSPSEDLDSQRLKPSLYVPISVKHELIERMKGHI